MPKDKSQANSTKNLKVVKPSDKQIMGGGLLSNPKENNTAQNTNASVPNTYIVGPHRKTTSYGGLTPG